MKTERVKTVTSSECAAGIFDLSMDIATDKYVTTCGEDSRLSIWSSATGKPLRSYKVTTAMEEEYSAAVQTGQAEGGGASANAGAGSSASASASGRVMAADAAASAASSMVGGLFKMAMDPSGIYMAVVGFDRAIRLVDFYSGRVDLWHSMRDGIR
jgi:hypothetical protein